MRERLPYLTLILAVVVLAPLLGAGLKAEQPSGPEMPDFAEIQAAIEELESAIGRSCTWSAKVCSAEGLQSLSINCGGRGAELLTWSAGGTTLTDDEISSGTVTFGEPSTDLAIAIPQNCEAESDGSIVCW